MSSKKEVFNRFVQFISSIITHPSMYGVQNVEGINVFIWGFRCACRNGDGEIVEAFCADFRNFLNTEFAEDFVKKGDFDWPG